MSEASMTRDLRLWGNPVRSELQEAFTEPLLALAARVEAYVEEYPEEVNAIANWRPADKVPYGVHDLPPNLYEHCNNPAPFIPASTHELSRFMDSFWERHLRLHASTPGFHAHAIFPEFRDNLTANLRQRMEQDNGINLEEWATYQQSYRTQLERGFYTLGHNTAVMNLPWITEGADVRGVFEYATGRQKSYLLAGMSSPHRIGLYLRVPVGEYGYDFADRLIRTTSFMYDFIENDTELKADLWRQFGHHGKVISEHTDRGLLNGRLYSAEESMLTASQEGIGSMLEAINLATAERVGDYTADDLLAGVVRHDIVNKITLLAPLGVAGATSLFGTYIPGVLEADHDRLTVGPAFTTNLQEIRRLATGRVYQEWIDYQEQVSSNDRDPTGIRPPSRTGLTCPLAGPYRTNMGLLPGAVSRLSETFLKVYQCIGERVEQQQQQRLPWGLLGHILK